MISCWKVESLVFPSCVYDSVTLTVLRVSMPYTFKLPMRVCFSSLRELYLVEVKFLKANSDELHFGFPVLQVLSLQTCEWTEAKIVNINAPKLLKFYLEYDDMWNGDGACDIVFKIRAPNLSDLKWHDYPSIDINLCNPSSATNATIDVSCSKANEELKRKMGLKICSILRYTLKSLTLSSATIKLLGRVEDLHVNMPLYDDMLCLSFGVTSGGTLANDPTLMTLLKKSPLLESIFFNMIVKCVNIDEMEQESVLECLSHLSPPVLYM